MRVVFFDLDNTLYDWVHYFAHAMTAMSEEVSRTSGLPRSVIISEAQQVFRRHGTVEYGFWVQELPSLQALHPGVSGHDLARLYWPAIERFKETRRQFLRPYRGVEDGLSAVREAGIKTVALTDATHWHANHRLHALGLTSRFDWLVARPDVAIPTHTDLVLVSGGAPAPRSPAAFHGLQAGLRKPDPNILWDACEAMRVDIESAAVVGDSIQKDIAMAQAAGAWDIWAAYGVPAPEDLEVVVSVSDWSPSEIGSVTRGQPEPAVHPRYTADSFDEVVAILTGTRQLP